MKTSNEKIDTVINILESIKEMIKTPKTNVLHSRFDTKEELTTELEGHILKLRREDFSNIEELIILFAPTSDYKKFR